MNKHLTLQDRIQIQQGLSSNLSFKKIALSIHKDCTTISKEVRRNLSLEKPSYVGTLNNRCVHHSSCSLTSLCHSCYYKKKEKPCRLCHKQNCNQLCPSFQLKTCDKLIHAPYVCNGCSQQNRCPLDHVFYRAEEAQLDYKIRLSESRSGISLTADELNQLNLLLNDLIVDKKQSPYHALVNNEDVIPCSLKTLYNYIHLGVIEARPIDLPRAVRYRPRKKKSIPKKADKQCRKGRTYSDYESYLSEHPDSLICQMDTVEGVKGGKCILTLHFPHMKFQIGFLRDSNTARSVTDIFLSLYHTMGALFFDLFDVILTDNGSEFSDPSAIEKITSASGKHIRIFYCEPNRSDQKGACENNHEHFRRIAPKGTSFNTWNQDMVDHIFSHINSFSRLSLNGKSPYHSFLFLYGCKTLRHLNIFYIEPNDIVLSPKLLHKLLKEGEQ